MQEIEICVDDQNSEGKNRDFEGFKFLEYGSSTTVDISADCPAENWKVLDLTNKRLIGFKVIISDHLSDDRECFKNIRSICPIVDSFEDETSTVDCENTQFDLSGLRSMVAVIGGGPDTQVFKSDSYSTYYGNKDGYSFCLGTYTLEFSPNDIGWLSFSTSNN